MGGVGVLAVSPMPFLEKKNSFRKKHCLCTKWGIGGSPNIMRNENGFWMNGLLPILPILSLVYGRIGGISGATNMLRRGEENGIGEDWGCWWFCPRVQKNCYM